MPSGVAGVAGGVSANMYSGHVSKHKCVGRRGPTTLNYIAIELQPTGTIHSQGLHHLTSGPGIKVGAAGGWVCVCVCGGGGEEGGTKVYGRRRRGGGRWELYEISEGCWCTPGVASGGVGRA